MPQTGIPVDSQTIVYFKDLKLRKKYKYMIMSIMDDKIIKTEKVGSGDKQELITDLPKKDCRYIVYDDDQVLFISWVPECAPTRSKMIYAGSKENVMKALEGCKAARDAHEMSDLSIIKS